MAEPADGADPSTKGGRVAARLRPLRSVRVRITLAAALVIAVAMVATGWLLVRSVERSQVGAIGNDAEDVLDQVTGRLAAGVPAEEAVRPEELATAGFVEITYADGSWIRFVPIFNVETGEVELGISRPDPDNPAPAPPEQPHVEEPEASDEVVAVPGGANDDDVPPVVGFPVEQRSAHVDTASGEVNVTVAAPLDQVAGSLDAVRRALTIGFPLIVGLVALAAWWTVGRALRPVERIRAEADAIGASTLHRRVSEPGTGDEVNRLSRTMNAMLERLESAVTRQRQFVADASHELRNPVAGIRTNLEVALREGERAEWTDVAREVLAEEARLESLIGDLLVLAAEDEGAATLPRTELDLTELAASEARRSRRVPVSSVTGSDVVVLGSHNQLQRAPREPGRQRRATRQQPGSHRNQRPDRMGPALGGRRRPRHPTGGPGPGVRTLHPPRRRPGPRPGRLRPRAGGGSLDRHPPPRSGVGRRQPARRRPLHHRPARARPVVIPAPTEAERHRPPPEPTHQPHALTAALPPVRSGVQLVP